MKNYYDILGLEQNSSFVEIKSAYRALMSKLHPDINPQKTEFFEKKSKLINEAYEILSNVAKRNKYDRELNNFLNNKSNNQSQHNYSKYKEEELTKREEELKCKQDEINKKQNEVEKIQREREETFKQKEAEFYRSIFEQKEKIKDKKVEKVESKLKIDIPFTLIGIIIVVVLMVIGVTPFLKKSNEKREQNAIELENDSSNYNGAKIINDSVIIKRTNNIDKNKVKTKNKLHVNQSKSLEKDNFINQNQNNQKEQVIYDEIEDLHKGLSRITRDGKYGFIDMYQNEVVPAIYDKAELFYEDRSIVVKDGKEQVKNNL